MPRKLAERGWARLITKHRSVVQPSLEGMHRSHPAPARVCHDSRDGVLSRSIVSHASIRSGKPKVDMYANTDNSFIADDLIAEIRRDFERACTELVRAKNARAEKDTPSARTQVSSCLDRVDGILDMWNDAERYVSLGYGPGGRNPSPPEAEQRIGALPMLGE
jgi:hypothetical protein